MVWYEKNFNYTAKPHTRVFLHIGAANYRSFVWVNAKKVCEHEGGFTPFDCEVTQLLHDGDNVSVIAVDNTRHADGVPTRETDWWNYGGLTRDVSLVEVPLTFIDDYDLHLSKTDRTMIEGWVHVQGGHPHRRWRFLPFAKAAASEDPAGVRQCGEPDIGHSAARKTGSQSDHNQQWPRSTRYAGEGTIRPSSHGRWP